MSFEPALTYKGEPCKMCAKNGEYCAVHNGNDIIRPKVVSGLWRKAYLKALRSGVTKRSAAGIAKVTENTVYKHQRNDAAFADKVEIAYNKGTHRMEKLGWERASDKDNPSDSILKHLLAVRGVQPVSKVEVSGPDGGPIALQPTINFDLLSPGLKLQIITELEAIDKGEGVPLVIEGEVVPLEDPPSSVDKAPPSVEGDAPPKISDDDE